MILQVLCFYCDGGLNKWDPSDDPWTEHAKWFPMCGYLILKKGADFVDKIQQDMIRGDNDSGTGSLPNSHTNSSEESDPEQNPGPMGGDRVPNSQGPDEDRKRNSKPDKVQVETGSVRASQPKTPKGSRKEKKVQPELSKEEILEENRRLKEERLCKICLDNEKEVCSFTAILLHFTQAREG